MDAGRVMSNCPSWFCDFSGALQATSWVSGWSVSEQSKMWIITVIAGGGHLIKISQAGRVMLVSICRPNISMR